MGRKPVIYSVDFDGTLCVECWPGIGEPNLELIEHLKAKKEKGAKLILNTCREGKELEEAVQWCAYHGLYFDAVNENLPELTEQWGYTRKIFANVYIDDDNVDRHGVYANLPFKGNGEKDG